MGERQFLTGWCGRTLISDDKGVLRRVTYREPSHRRCPVVIAGTQCECSCHHGGKPWDELGVAPAREKEPVYDRKTLPVPPRTPVERSVDLSGAVTEVPREKGTDMAAEMQRLLDEMEDE